MTRPLADRMRPETFADVFGDEKLFSDGGIFPKMIETGHIPNMIFYGPSGTGKTTAANILSKAAGKTMRRLNATSASLSDIKEVVAETSSLYGSDGVLLYLDEIQYFNKKQQQSLLEFIEDGRITLIASTTENPYFYVYSAIISRSAVFEFKPLSVDALSKAIERARKFLSDEKGAEIICDADAVRIMAQSSAGDARRAINLFENIAVVSDGHITAESVRTFLPDVMMSGFDKSGDGHYDLLSAYQKSIRGSDPDAAVFYLAKILSGGDLLSACRRIQVIASEDIGLAYPMAAAITHACVESALKLGLPEASIPLANATVMLATAPKSNSAYLAYGAAAADVASGKGAVPPRTLQNVHLDGENVAQKGQNYKYPHDFKNHYVGQQYLPDDLKNKKYYEFGENKTEQAAKAYWELIKNGGNK
ncbi:MAG: replication-associated recombination protein A [Eubacteriales bacterium]|nr:replication-associated recombination protein A [Eubacterium sp.]MDD7573364.1 replication-associated recombination protein A [Eubacteriales bacterium]